MTLAQQMLEDSRLQAETKSKSAVIKASDLIALFRKARNERWGYIWGEAGGVWTQAEQNAATREKTVQYGQKWVGKRVADCSGLFRWAVAQLGGSIYHGSNTIWKSYTDSTRRGAVGGKMEIRRGTAVFQVKDGVRHHIGLYVGEGKYGKQTVIEARGTNAGVIESTMSEWAEWGELLVKVGGELVKVDYDVPAETIEIAQRTMRKGDSGADVEALQEALVAAGSDVGKRKDGTPLIDGKYGTETVSAVREYQYDHGLTPDGIAGPLTLAALRDVEPDEPDEDEDDREEQTEAPSTWDSMTLAEKVEDLHKRLMAVEGGESIG